MIIKKPSWHISESEVTPEHLFKRRREFMKRAGLFGTAMLLSPLANASIDVSGFQAGAIKLDEAITDEDSFTSYNNFYEFGTDKDDPSRNAGSLKTDNWKVEVSGLCGKPGTYDLSALIKPHPIEERIYRLRCVEAWSMVVPWLGVPLSSVLNSFEPGSDAKYVAFETLVDPEQMPGQNRRTIDWPYREGLTMAEAMHPLTLMVVGVYGKELPNQNGAPLRLITPWKYGFKGIKSIVEIEFLKKQPRTSWEISAPREYGFYANVNPAVDHPRWSQASERRIGSGLFAARIPTQMFNGYGEHVAHLYDGLDLRKNY